MSAEFRLSDEQYRDLIDSIAAGIPRHYVESLVASEREAAERALVAELLGILDAGTHDTKLVTLDRLRAALTRPDAEGEPDA